MNTLVYDPLMSREPCCQAEYDGDPCTCTPKGERMHLVFIPSETYDCWVNPEQVTVVTTNQQTGEVRVGLTSGSMVVVDPAFSHADVMSALGQG